MTQSIPLTDLEGGQAAQFNEVGDKHVGTILAFGERQQTKPGTGEVLTFNDGTPRMVTVITIQPLDGSEPVQLWARGGKFEVATGSGGSMGNAIAIAGRKAGAEKLEVGGQLAVAQTGWGVAKPGFNAPRLYSAEYRPPAPQTDSVAVDDLFA
jgi:hypothetical protein